MRRGPKTHYNVDQVVADIKKNIPRKQIAKKHGISVNMVTCINSRYVNNTKKIVPPKEQAIRALLRGVKHQRIVSRWGKDIYKEAKTWV